MLPMGTNFDMNLMLSPFGFYSQGNAFNLPFMNTGFPSIYPMLNGIAMPAMNRFNAGTYSGFY